MNDRFMKNDEMEQDGIRALLGGSSSIFFYFSICSCNHIGDEGAWGVAIGIENLGLKRLWME